ncbi:MAG: SEL1-like repeat protein [Rhodospirillales bacterium]|nr:SEL1-like repeat protein [Rhodospirillales bacterium]
MQPLSPNRIPAFLRIAATVLAVLVISGMSIPAWAGYEEELQRYLDRNDSVGAFRLTKKYAERGDPKAQVEITVYYRNNWGLGDKVGVGTDFRKACEWYLKAAKQNYPPAYANSGYCYDPSEGGNFAGALGTDYAMARKWYVKAANSSDGELAALFAANLYAKGLGGPIDLDKSRQMYELAGDYGAFFLGTIYENGSGTPVDLDRALKFYDIGSKAEYSDHQADSKRKAESLRTKMVSASAKPQSSPPKPKKPATAVATLPPKKPAPPKPAKSSSASLDITFKKGPSRPDDIAAIIGNGDYGKLAKDIPNVDPAHADADSFKRYAIQALGIREGNIIDLRDATSAQMERVFGSDRTHKGQLFNWVQPDISNVHVYYAGHGAPAGDDGTAYLVPSDAAATAIDINGYPLDVLYRNLGKLPAKSVTVVLEACFSGASQGGTVIPKASGIHVRPKVARIPGNITVIAAGSPDQLASWEQDGSHGLFTKYYLTGMSGLADQKPHGNADGKVSYNEVKSYLKRTLTYFARRYYGRDQEVQIVVGKSR